MKVIKVKDFIDLVDADRESEEYVEILDHDGKVAVKAMVCSEVWDSLAERTVNSIQAEKNTIQIWLDDKEDKPE